MTITEAEWERARRQNAAIRAEAERSARRRQQGAAVDHLIDLTGTFAERLQDQRALRALERAAAESEGGNVEPEAP